MRIGLIGNPNVGKSLIFHQLTGLGVEVSNYPGSTVNLQHGTTCFGKMKLEIIDLPGTYSLDGDSEEEKIVRSFVTRGEADVLVAVLDAVHLERNLYLFLQAAEFRRPMLLILNMTDEAEKEGIAIETVKLASILGVEVIPTAAIQGRNTNSIIPAALSSARIPTIEVPYDHHIEAAEKSLATEYGLTRPEALGALLGHADNTDVKETAATLAVELERIHHMSVSQIIAGNRHHCAERISSEVTGFRPPAGGSDIDRLLTTRIPGIPILIAVLVSILVTVFFIGTVLEEAIVSLITTYVLVPFVASGFPPLAEQLGVSLILGVQAGLGIAFPFIFTFYLFIAILEDSGYLTRAAFLADRSLHRFGMHGQG
ncbi:MAG: ferrous iron transporter B, partial [Methanoregulaceae archaeon]|nr:ferrous iron transporter B [Methanoregulaceae archaeon]